MTIWFLGQEHAETEPVSLASCDGARRPACATSSTRLIWRTCTGEVVHPEGRRAALRVLFVKVLKPTSQQRLVHNQKLLAFAFQIQQFQNNIGASVLAIVLRASHSMQGSGLSPHSADTPLACSLPYLQRQCLTLNLSDPRCCRFRFLEICKSWERNFASVCVAATFFASSEQLT